ncbi:MAG: GGDEF domain-containing protein [Pseudomonadota bacterium]
MFLQIHHKIIEIFSPKSPATILLFSLLLLILLGWIDLITGDYSLIIFYLIPVSLVAWFVGNRSGILFCFLSVAVRLIIDEKDSGFSFKHSMLHYWNDLIEFIFLLIMSTLFSVLRKNLNTEKELSSRDPLTGALNRRSFFDLAEYEINRSHRYGLPFTVAYVDLDNFKWINDQLGHRIGDQLLVTVVSTFHSNIRSTDILARFGGDEFVILLPETSGEAAVMFLNKIHSHLDQQMGQNNWPVSFSIGAATYLKAPETADEAIHKADELMYKVKHSGKSRLLHEEILEDNHG